jgi:hypothetical protein
MNLSALITSVKRQAPDWSRSEIMEILNDIQFLMLSHPTSIGRVIDPDTGKDFELETVAEQFVYEITDDATPAFIEDGLFVDSVSSDGDDIDAEKEGITFVQATNSTPAKIIFRNDPNGNTYSVKYYRKPANLTAEKSPLLIPDGWILNGLREGAIVFINMISHGGKADWKDWNNDELKSFWAEMNDTPGSIHYTQPSRGY